jgi:hypothetical protein
VFKDDETWEDLGTDGTHNLHISGFSKHQIILVKEGAEELAKRTFPFVRSNYDEILSLELRFQIKFTDHSKRHISQSCFTMKKIIRFTSHIT